MNGKAVEENITLSILVNDKLRRLDMAIVKMWEKNVGNHKDKRVTLTGMEGKV